jgi:ParB/RepB/Spo0J family partition protein
MAAKTVLSNVCDVVRRSDVYHIDPEHIDVVDGWNPRTDFGGEDELVASIKANGVKRPLLVRKTADNELKLVDGERRLRAVFRARDEGAEIVSVPVIVEKKGTSEVDLFVDAIIANDGKPFLPTEEAAAFKKMVNWGLTQQQIAERTGKSVSHVRNRIELDGASPDVKRALNEGEINIGQAQTIAKESDGSVEKQKEKLVKAKEKKPQQMHLKFKDGELKRTGVRGVSCEPIENLLENSDFISAVAAAGFDPDSIKVSIVPVFEERE